MYHADIHGSSRKFIESILSQPPTLLAVQNARKILSTNTQDLRLETRMLLNDWIDLAKIHIDRAGGGRGTALDEEIEKLALILSQVARVQICLSDDQWKQVLLFSLGQHRVHPLGTIKHSAYGKIKRGVLVHPDPNSPGKYLVSSTKVAIKLSSISLATQGRRTTGEQIFESAERELAVLNLLARFGHPYVMNMVASGRDDSNLVVLTPLGRFSVWDKLQNFEIENLLEYIHRVRVQIGSALMFIHAMGIAHRDISLENILEMDDGSLKLIDFGLAVSLTLADPDSGSWMPIPLERRDGRVFAVGKMRYLAPEFFRRDQDMTRVLYDATKSDVFSLAVCLFVLAYKGFPYQHIYLEARLEPTVQQLVSFWNDYADDFYSKFDIDPKLDWLRSVMAKDATKRLTAKQCVELIPSIA